MYSPRPGVTIIRGHLRRPAHRRRHRRRTRLRRRLRRHQGPHVPAGRRCATSAPPGHAEFLGASAANLAMDRGQLLGGVLHRGGGERADRRMPPSGSARRAGGSWPRSTPTSTASTPRSRRCARRAVDRSCPVEYAALQKTPEPWDRADIVYVASLVGGIFGKGGGGEFANALWLQQLQAKFGRTRAGGSSTTCAIDDDPEAPTTVARQASRTAAAGRPAGRAGVALPDLDGPTAPGTGATPRSDDAVPGRWRALRATAGRGSTDRSGRSTSALVPAA